MCSKAKDKAPPVPAALTASAQEYGAACFAAGVKSAQRDQAGLLALIADIRAAAGDPDGKLMQGELVGRICQLAGPPAPKDAAQKTAEKLLPTPRKFWGMATDIDGAPALYTENDVLECLVRAYQQGRRDGQKDDVEALRAAEMQRIGEEEADWADHRRGVGPKPSLSP